MNLCLLIDHQVPPPQQQSRVPPGMRKATPLIVQPPDQYNRYVQQMKAQGQVPQPAPTIIRLVTHHPAQTIAR